MVAGDLPFGANEYREAIARVCRRCYPRDTTNSFYSLHALDYSNCARRGPQSSAAITSARMGTAGIRIEIASDSPGARPRRNKPPLPLRPLHGLWRRAIDEIDLRRLALPVRGLPSALEGLSACQISDFHVDRDEDLQRLGRAVELINCQKPALVFLTGDYFSGRETMRRYLGGFARELRKLRPLVGIFAIAGNHDHWASFEPIASAMAGAGIEVLRNSSRRLEIEGSALTVVGID